MIKDFLLRHRRSRSSGEGPGGRSERVKEWLRRSGCLTFRREPIARGIAVGLLVGLTPTVGFQTMIIVAGCLLIRGNFPAAFGISWVSNPFTLPPMILAYHELGDTLFGPWLKTIFGGTDWIDEALVRVISTGLGSLLIAVPVALIGYFATLGMSEVWHRRRHRARQLRRQTSRDESRPPPD